MTTDLETSGEPMAFFGHHPEPVIDFLIEVEELESIAENARLGLTGFGHEEDRAKLDERIDRALIRDFRVGVDQQCVAAKQALRELARRRGFNLMTEIAYAGQPTPRISGNPQS
jgi:hypothetical protein